MQVTVCRLVMGAAKGGETSEEEGIGSVRFQYLWDAKAVNPTANPIRPGTRMKVVFGETGALTQRRKREVVRGPG